MNNINKIRFWEIDALRGIAIIMMIASNFVTDLQYFAGYASYETFWWVFARTTAFIFIFLVGISLTISYSRAKQDEKANFWKYFKRGSYIFALGLIITVTTFFFLQQDFIRFGVLHLIGISIILSFPFLKIKKYTWIFPLAILLILAGEFIKNIYINSNWLLWLGLTTQTFSSIDYFPLLPWFGVVLLGIVFGKLLYPNATRGHILKIAGSEHRITKPLSFLGRNSLLIYFIHQPILLGLLWLLVL